MQILNSLPRRFNPNEARGDFSRDGKFSIKRHGIGNLSARKTTVIVPLPLIVLCKTSLGSIPSRHAPVNSFP